MFEQRKETIDEAIIFIQSILIFLQYLQTKNLQEEQPRRIKCRLNGRKSMGNSERC